MRSRYPVVPFCPGFKLRRLHDDTVKCRNVCVVPGIAVGDCSSSGRRLVKTRLDSFSSSDLGWKDLKVLFERELQPQRTAQVFV